MMMRLTGPASEDKKNVFSSFFYPAIFVLILWIVHFIQFEMGVYWVEYGLFPRTFSGLKGIVLMPFLHSGLEHLFNNSIPLLILGTSLFYFYRKVAFRVFILVIFAGGIWTWISAREAYHIGASGLVYGLFGFLFLSGFIRVNKSLMAISFLVAFIYGSLVWNIFPLFREGMEWGRLQKDYMNISWEGHLWGLLAGMVLAIYYRKEGPQREVYLWEEEEEEDENFPGYPYKEPPGEENDGEQQIRIQYHYKPGKKEE